MEKFVSKILGERLILLSQVKKARDGKKEEFAYIVDSLSSNGIVINHNSDLKLDFNTQYIIDDNVLHAQMLELIALLKNRLMDTRLDILFAKINESEPEITASPIAHEVFNEFLEKEKLSKSYTVSEELKNIIALMGDEELQLR